MKTWLLCVRMLQVMRNEGPGTRDMIGGYLINSGGDKFDEALASHLCERGFIPNFPVRSACSTLNASRFSFLNNKTAVVNPATIWS